MTKIELIKRMAAITNTGQEKCRVYLDAFIQAVIEGMLEEQSNGDEPAAKILPEFGTFKVKDVAERTGKITVGDRIGERYTKPAYKRVAFTPAKQLEDKFNE